MRLVTFEHNGAEAIGVLDSGVVVHIRATAPDLPPTMVELLAAGPAALDAASEPAPDSSVSRK